MRPCYSLCLNGETLLEVRVQAPAWLPRAPVVKPSYLRFAIRDALARAFRN